MRIQSFFCRSLWLTSLLLVRTTLAVAAPTALEPTPSTASAPLQTPGVELPAILTLERALELLHTRGLDVLIAETQVEHAAADLRTARQVYNPSVFGLFGKSFNYRPAEVCLATATRPAGQGCSSFALSVGISDQAALSDVVEGKRGLRIDVASRALAAARLDRDDARRQLEFQVKQLYFQALGARAQRDFAREAAESATQTLALNEVRYKAGAISEADVAKAETAQLETQQTLDLAEQTLRAAKVQLAYLLGVRTLVPDFAIEDERIRFRVPAELASASREGLFAQALMYRPDVKSLVAQGQRFGAELQAARRSRVPDFALSVQYTQEGVVSLAIQPPTLNFGISATLPVFYQSQGEIARARAELKRIDLQRARLQAQVVSELETAFGAYGATRHRVERMESQLLERARRTRDLIAIQYQKGAASLLEYLDAQRTYIAINEEYFQDLTDYWTAVAALEQAIGRELQ